MKPFGEFIMRSQRNAGLLALVFALLPFLNWLSVIIMALVTLRRGAKQGFLILICVLLPSVVWLFISKNDTVLLNIIVGATVVWILASVLHKTHSWSYVLLAGAFIGAVVIVALHGSINDMNAWWAHKMSSYMQSAGKEMEIDTSAQQAMIAQLAKFATGLQAAAIFLVDIVWLAVARYWQALLYNQGQLRPELYKIQLPKWSTVVLVIVGLIAYATKMPMLIDMLPMLFVAYTLAGISLVHFVVSARKVSWLWLVLLYAGLVFALPYMVAALVIVAICDSWFNLRRLYATQQA